MILNLATISTDLLNDEGILGLFLNASWQNLLFFVLFAVVIAFGANRLTKPQKELQKEQNEILTRFSEKITELVTNTTVEEKIRDERDANYRASFDNTKDILNRGFDKVDKDLKQINETLIRHNATRCAASRVIKEVTDESSEE